jgi:hypothetical protein
MEGKADAKDKELVKRAFDLANDAHKNVKRKSGDPYIVHPLEVALVVAKEIGLGPTSIAAALLHDVVEDGPGWTFERLDAEGFSPEVLTPLRLVTKTPDDAGDDLNAYLRFGGRCRAHPVARRVKMADIKDNLDLTRLAQFTDRERLRVSKYLAAVRLLEATPG